MADLPENNPPTPRVYNIAKVDEKTIYPKKSG